MGAYLISIPVMLVLSVLQSTAISRINLLSGSADIVMLAVAAWAVKEKGYKAFVWAWVGGLYIAADHRYAALYPNSFLRVHRAGRRNYSLAIFGRHL